MSRADNSLTREKIQQLIAAVGVAPEKDVDANIDAVDYDWHQSHYFNRTQLQKINGFAMNLAQNFAQIFNRLYHCDFNVNVVSVSQHFAGEILNNDDKEKDYFLAFGNSQQPFGLISIPPKTALLWASQLLGGTQSEEDRNLSPLEQSLLFDIASAVIGAFSDSLNDSPLSTVGEIVKNSMSLEMDSAKDVCKIVLNVKKSDSETVSEVYFIIFCDKLQAIAGQMKQQGDNVSPQNISKAMLNHVQSVPIPVTVKLAEAKFNFHDLMNIQADDIILLNKKVTEPAELIINNIIPFRGRLAKSDKKFALVITEMCNTK